MFYLISQNQINLLEEYVVVFVRRKELSEGVGGAVVEETSPCLCDRAMPGI
jgi:hypothetical protein